MGKHTTPAGEMSTAEKIQGHRTPNLENDYQPRHDADQPPAQRGEVIDRR